MDTVLQDFRHAIRSLLKSPGFTTAAVLTLALGIGANSAIFSIVEAVMLRTLPYRDSSRLVLVADADSDNGGFLYKDADALKAQSSSFEDLAVYFRDSGYSRATLTVGNEPQQVQGAWISANLFSMMGIAPETGRVFTHEEEVRQEIETGFADAASCLIYNHLLRIRSLLWRPRNNSWIQALLTFMRVRFSTRAEIPR